MKRIDLNEIKKLVENISGCKNIQTRSRQRHFTYIRYIYCKVAERTNRYNLTQIGSPIHRDHSTVIHALKEFDKNTGNNYFEFYDNVYAECLQVLGISKSRQDSAENDYRMRFIKYCVKQKEIVGGLKKKLDAFRYKKLIHHLAMLDDQDYKEAEEKISAFLSMNRIKSKYNFENIE